ncbi:MAG: bifunctional shikimate kinase/3-dehydroquinate synthase [Deltaproteobacteria bacterium]|jgi:3-dehydroquinate synthetase/shikimate kinase|nr:bifunctional shikimate kinase/3-dehydroquinate synthase [Deltaproteobacteria bacterium]
MVFFRKKNAAGNGPRDRAAFRPAKETGPLPLPPERHIFLTGFMGAGKSTVGPILAGLLGRPFLDLDGEIEKAEGAAVHEIFADPRGGEARFRKLEADLIRGLVASRTFPGVVALGGGAVEDPQTRRLLKSSVNCFFLQAEEPILWERASREGQLRERPLAKDREEFRKRLSRRLPLYRSCGMPVDSGASSPAEAAHAIVRLLFSGLSGGLSVRLDQPSALSAWPDLDSLSHSIAGRLSGRRTLLLLDPALRSEEPFWTAFLGEGSVAYPERRGEAAKTFASAESILHILAARSFDRSDWLLARGGGSLTDLAAFCAGVFKRGIKLLLMPTTLLAAVDASVGGKAAVNFAGAKNQCGIFYLPDEVLIEGEVLRRLPRSLVEEGLSEAYKTGLVLDPDLSGLIAREIESLLPPEGAPGPDLPLLLETAWRGASLKAGVVSEDFREETGRRAVLNFGHTFGHAAESYYSQAEVPLSHGRAVAYGMAAALVLSERAWGLDPGFAREARSVCLRLSRGGYPPIPPREDLSRLFLADKKARHGKLKFIALKAPGEPALADLDPEDLIRAAEEAVREAKAREIRPWSRL